MLAVIIYLLEKFVESKHIQSFGLFQVPECLNELRLCALTSHQCQKPTPQLLRAHGLVYQLEIDVDKTIATGIEIVLYPDGTISNVI